ncbi:MAG: twin-arginine translocase subunit TatC, partial [Candidatus Aureabacteria bacterium]|nr:twin-arginine translocase subunit TatC [Candidatus Auribacterota bacterium]
MPKRRSPPVQINQRSGKIKNRNSLTIFEHVEELRKRVIRLFFLFAALLIIFFIFSGELLGYLSLTIAGKGEIIYTEVYGIFLARVKTSILFSIFMIFPF